MIKKNFHELKIIDIYRLKYNEFVNIFNINSIKRKLIDNRSIKIDFSIKELTKNLFKNIHKYALNAYVIDCLFTEYTLIHLPIPKLEIITLSDVEKTVLTDTWKNGIYFKDIVMKELKSYVPEWDECDDEEDCYN